MIKDNWIEQKRQEFLVEDNVKREAEHEPSGKLSASMLFQPVRFQVMKSIGIPPRGIEPYVLGKFKRGNQAEDSTVEDLKRANVLVEAQKLVEYRGVTGYADAVVDTNQMLSKKGIMPWEIKSVTNAKLKRIASTEVDYHYKLQGCLYAMAMKTNYYAIVVVSAEDLRVEPNIFQTSELAGEVNQIITKYDLAMKRWGEQGKLPELEENPKVKWATDPRYARYDESWTDEKVINYLNDKKIGLRDFSLEEIQICPNCGKPDVYAGDNHNCTSIEERIDSTEHLWR